MTQARKAAAPTLPLTYYLNLKLLTLVAKACAPKALTSFGDTDAESLRKKRNIVAHNNDFEPGHHRA